MSTLNSLPLLSGPLPTPSTDRTQNSCRKCNKEFVLFFTRSTRCNHCGYSYCQACADYLALMPRRGTHSGYDQVHVCAYCIDLLNITASSKNQLKSQPLSRLSNYVQAYNISIKGPIDKNDLIDTIIAARTPSGTLPQENESYYRANAVPSHRPARPRGLFSTRPPPPPQPRPSAQPVNFPRPDLDSQAASSVPDTSSTRQRQTSSSHAPPPRFRTTSQPQFRSSSQPHPPYPSPPHPFTADARSSAPRPPPRPSTASTPMPTQTPTPAPTHIPPPPLSALLAMSESSLSRLPVHTLKQILHEARVRLPPDVLEKGELVARVSAWVEEERMAAEETERAEREEREQEERERLDREEEEERERIWAQRSATEMEPEDDPMHDESQPHHPPPSSSPPSSPPKTTSVEKSGLCVICQDHEANIAIVDCGHLAMCRACSELVLASTRECPLCRTRIVTEARLLRIFKT